MKLNAIQNQGYMSYRKSNENKIAFQGIDVQPIRNGIIQQLKNGCDKYGYSIKTTVEAKEMTDEAKKIFKVLDKFNGVKFNLNDYKDHFDGHKRTAFDELIKKLGDKANDFPVKMDNNESYEWKYYLPSETGIYAISHRADIYDEENDGVTPNEDVLIYESEDDKIATDGEAYFFSPVYDLLYDEMVGRSKYFTYYPKSVKAVKDFLIACIERFILKPRVEKLEAESAESLASETARYLEEYAKTLKE